MACFFSTNGDGLDDRAARLFPLELDDVEFIGKRLVVVPRRLFNDPSWEFCCNASFERFPLAVADISWFDNDKELRDKSELDIVSRKRPIAWTKAAHVGAKKHRMKKKFW